MRDRFGGWIRAQCLDHARIRKGGLAVCEAESSLSGWRKGER